MTKEQEVEIIKLYNQKFSNRIIAKRTGYNHKAIGAFLKRMNLPFHKKGSIRAEFINEETIRCSKCKKDKYINEYLIMRKGQKNQYRLSYCNKCRSDQNIKNMNSNPLKVLRDIFNRLVNRCKKENYPFNLDWDYFINIYNLQNKLCFYSNNELSLIRGKKYNPDGCTVDKIIPELGYIKGNVVLCTKRYNTVKSDLTLNEIKTHMPNWFNKLINTNWLDLKDKI